MVVISLEPKKRENVVQALLIRTAVVVLEAAYVVCFWGWLGFIPPRVVFGDGMRPSPMP